MQNQGHRLGQRYHFHEMTKINFLSLDFQLNFQITTLIILVSLTTFKKAGTFYCAYPTFYNRIHKPKNLKNFWRTILYCKSKMKLVFEMKVPNNLFIIT